jgi:hypothetical protein
MAQKHKRKSVSFIDVSYYKNDPPRLFSNIIIDILSFMLERTDDRFYSTNMDMGVFQLLRIKTKNRHCNSIFQAAHKILNDGKAV